MFGALIRAAERWRSIKVTEFEHRQITSVRKELDQEYEAQVGLKTQLSKDAAPVKISSNLRTYQSGGRSLTPPLICEPRRPATQAGFCLISRNLSASSAITIGRDLTSLLRRA